MHGFKVAAAAAAVFAGAAIADVDCDNSTATYTITDAASATIACETVKGSIAFATSVAGSVTIEGPEAIEGDVIINNATQLTGLSSTSVTKISGNFELNEVQILESINFPNLRSVGQLTWIALPTLDTVNFGTSGVTTVSSIRISNTFISTLEGMDLVSVDTFQIDNNRNLKTWSTGLKNITGSLIIASNGANLEISLPNLTLAKDIDVRSVKSFSMPLLATVSNGIAFSNTTNLESISAPKLTTVGQSVAINGNEALTNISMNALTTIGGGLTITNNDKLESVNGFEKLNKVAGAVNVRGNLTEVSFPSLNDVKGTFDVISTADVSESCTTFKKLSSSGKIQGKLTCTSATADSTTGGSKPLSSGSSSSNSSGSSDNAAGTQSSNAIFLSVAIAGAIAALL
ncbi:Protein ecm33 [Ceratocystis lukuohia]|uniref:Protein ecm33 n=1 Tax=Ceratocystis lukuohia TaxID=2019550 RepID=A0ABR4MKR8_9PEZI